MHPGSKSPLGTWMNMASMKGLGSPKCEVFPFHFPFMSAGKPKEAGLRGISCFSKTLAPSLGSMLIRMCSLEVKGENSTSQDRFLYSFSACLKPPV